MTERGPSGLCGACVDACVSVSFGTTCVSDVVSLWMLNYMCVRRCVFVDVELHVCQTLCLCGCCLRGNSPHRGKNETGKKGDNFTENGGGEVIISMSCVVR